jgi:pimeloyl-ACP methyl ester carboxylesterase
MAEISESVLTAPTTGLAIHYREWGGFEPNTGDGAPVVLLHGLASSCRIFDLCAPLLAASRRVVAYDQRGHGQTAKPETDYQTETFVADGVGLAEALELKEPYVLAGHSWGASIALAWAVRHPERVRAVVLIDGAIFPFHEVPSHTWESTSALLAPPDLSMLTFEQLLEMTREGLAFLEDGFRRSYFQSLFHIGADGHIRPQLSRDKHMRILRAMWDEDVDALFAALRRPTLALLAEPAPNHSPEREVDQLRRRMVARLQAAQPLLSLRWLPNTIHDVPLQRPGELAEVILSLC